MQLLADVAGDSSVPSLWDLLWPVLGWACISVLVAVPAACLLVVHLMNLVAHLFYRPMGNEPAPERSAVRNASRSAGRFREIIASVPYPDNLPPNGETKLPGRLQGR
jgi:hypothetical protein